MSHALAVELSAEKNIMSWRGAALIAEAIDITREQPQLHIAGMVIEPDAPKAETFRQFLPPGSRDPRRGFVGTVMRDIALKIIGAATPAALDWLEDNGAGARRKLPVFYAARSGARTATFDYYISI